jgi:hypothetical protein
MRTLILAVGLLVLAHAAFGADGTEVKVVRSWSGRIDKALVKHVPPEGIVLTHKQLQTLWKAWGVKDKLPRIDFEKHLVLVAAAPSSRLAIKPRLDEKGNLTFTVEATADLTRDAGYQVVLIPRAGVKTFKGKPVMKA